LEQITTPLRLRLRRHPSLRLEQVAAVARNYPLLIPAQYRIGLVEAARHKVTFGISELRVTSSRLTNGNWDTPEPEPGLSVCRFHFIVRNGKMTERWLPVANVSLHGLARRIERGRDRSPEAVLADIEVLATASGGEVETPRSEGCWLGEVVTARIDGRPVELMNVRTWINH
jgi:hypothetical protein